MPELFSLPFDRLNEGEQFATRGRTVTEADVVAFSSLTGDWHPQHTDAVWAASSVFGERIAHGMLLLSFAVGLLPFDPERVLALRRVEDVVFKRPAFIGDTVHAAGRIDSLSPVDDRAGLVTLAWRMENQHGELLLRARTQVLWAGDGARPSDDSPGLPLTAAGVLPL
ncbi:MAG TPA: MaoC/PaaZ C-terminal domain-containing protein [Thermoleophilaceae bacterium]